MAARYFASKASLILQTASSAVGSTLAAARLLVYVVFIHNVQLRYGYGESTNTILINFAGSAAKHHPFARARLTVRFPTSNTEYHLLKNGLPKTIGGATGSGKFMAKRADAQEPPNDS